MPSLTTVSGSDTAEGDLLESAQVLASTGFRVVPLHRPTSGGCSCSDPKCKHVGKHPRISNWKLAATTSVEQIAAWWEAWPDANVGIVLGPDQLVVDVDGPAGEAALSEFDLPTTACVRTGRGRHLYYAGARGTPPQLPKVDVFGEGRLIVAPPSLHHSGRRYTWSVPVEEGLAEAPQWLTSSARARGPRLPVQATTDRLTEGERNDGLFKRACLMRGAGLTRAELEAALSATNAETCSPPLDDDEVAVIARSAAKHPRGSFGDRRKEALALGPYRVAVYIALQSRMVGDIATVSHEELCEATNIGRTTVKAAIGDLEGAGLISISRDFFQRNTYHLL